jgi:hypothetical protein
MKAGQKQTDPFRSFVEVIVSGDIATAMRLLDTSPHLARERSARGATRQVAKENFFDRIQHYISEGDTALHVGAAAKQTRIVKELIARGADVRAKNGVARSRFIMLSMVGRARPFGILTSRP